ncbi:PIG-L family deacetylase [Candidatus Thorarchaeota archaeon]|nr:MAG: PIG-L family deacetylase [Candidatus Thorarchaeota archaeon]
MDSILVVVAHPDDESIGAGGTIRRHCDMGIPVDVHCMTGNETRNAELQEACSILGVRNLYHSARDDFAINKNLRNEVVGAILKTRPKILITHSIEDYNLNHQECAKIVFDAVEWASHVTIFDNAHRVERIYNMEVNTLISRPHVHVDVSDTYKYALAALKMHKSQISKADNFYEKLYDARTRLRGVQAMCERAEAFTITLPEHAGPFYSENNVSSLM